MVNLVLKMLLPLVAPATIQVLRKAIKLSRGGNTAVHAYRLLAQMKQVGLAGVLVTHA